MEEKENRIEAGSIELEEQHANSPCMQIWKKAGAGGGVSIN
jgi:hypothetical protein